MCEGVLGNVSPKDQLKTGSRISKPEGFAECLWWLIEDDVSIISQEGGEMSGLCEKTVCNML